ncbi:MAG: 5'-nucleotidase C-terminal domain-containing protein [Clostridia bacterium]|nr:5'-nucleotidase C-terminal domain-containing protein [Clostridia bacterium]
MKNIRHLTLLHSNDLHGDFLAEPAGDTFVGGISMLSGYIRHVRSTEENVLYSISGDIFRGSVIDTEYLGVSTIEMLNLLSPDAVTIGNHEIDYGIAHLLFIEKCADFPIINANLYIKMNGKRLFTPCRIAETGGMRVLFLGLITEDVMAQAKQDVIGSFIETRDAVREIGRICNAYRTLDIDCTVLLTHMGFEEDRRLAHMLDPAWGIDIILGGHSHTVMEQPVLENGILIAQAGTGTDSVGRFDLAIDTDRNCIDSYTWQFVPITAETCERDPEIEKIVDKYRSVTDAKYQRLVTRFHHALTHPERNRETELGNLFADIFRESLGVDVMLLGSGSIRSNELGPRVEYGGLRETFPFDDSVYMFKADGAQLRHMLRYMLRDEAFRGHTEFYQVSEGIRAVYSKRTQNFTEFSYFGRPVSDGQIFTVGIQSYHYANIGKFLDITYAELEKYQKPRVVSTSCLDIIDEYLSSHPILESGIEGRIIVVD